MRLKVLLLAAIFAISVMGFYSPAQAADGINPYVTIAQWAGWTSKSKEQMAATNGKSDTDYGQEKFANGGTLMGIRGEKNGVKAQFEFGAREGSASDANFFRNRHLWASYQMGAVELFFGQTLAPYVVLSGADYRSGDAMANAGACYDGWLSQIRLSFFGVYVQIMNPNGVSGIGSKQDSVIPKVAAGYMFKTDTFSVGVNAVGQQVKYDQETTTSTLDGKAITAWLANVIFKGQFGPANIAFVGYYAQNPGEMGFLSLNSNKAVVANTGDKYDNVKVMGGKVDAGFKIGTVAKINGGVAFEKAKSDNDRLSTSSSGYGTEGKDDFLAYYVNVQLFLADNCFVAPQVKVLDYKKSTDGVKKGTVTYAGAAFVASI